MEYPYTLSAKTNIKQTDKGSKVSIRQDEQVLKTYCSSQCLHLSILNHVFKFFLRELDLI